MKTQLSRSAKTRRDTGELTRDQRRLRERDAAQPGESLEAGRWQRRGLQPAVEPPPPSGLSALMRTAAEIREESNPAAKALLEARYKVEAAALAELSLDVNERKMKGVHAEIATVLEIVTQPLDVAGLTRADWQTLHRAILIIRRRSMQWLTTSRRFGAERWSQSFVEAAEAAPTKANAAP